MTDLIYWGLFAAAAFVLLFLVPLGYYRELQQQRQRRDWDLMPGATSSRRKR